ncbi:DUF6380 family protein [Streptomyces sp. BK239]|uniref:DUF6380 family protein n=1 Tax=Streptomyces sp. BK239 TaxID=2512155 RepID=UPI00387E7C97
MTGGAPDRGEATGTRRHATLRRAAASRPDRGEATGTRRHATLRRAAASLTATARRRRTRHGGRAGEGA